MIKRIWEISFSRPSYNLNSDVTDICLSVFCPDEIMQLDSSPLCAADITPDLKRQFAFLSGDTSFFFFLSVYLLCFACIGDQFVFSSLPCQVEFYFIIHTNNKKYHLKIK